MFPLGKKLVLIFRGSRDSFNADVYHKMCDNQGPFVCLVQSKNFNQIFGGYSCFSEKPGTDFEENGECFIFKYNNLDAFEKFKCID